MKRGSLAALVGRLRESVRPATAEAPDDELLRRWSQHRDEAAFELLVWRHGRLVLGVCQRILRSPQDVEDAFQATFLVLVRKGGNILRRQAVASWLYTVAYRVALDARSRRPRAQVTEAALDALPGREGPPSVRELGDVLDEEVGRLPEKYRQPFVLCYLQGRTNEEAARELGRPVGTILSRLSRARERLRERLSRRGIEPSSLAAPSALSTSALPDLVCTTTRAALSIAVQNTPTAIAPGAVVLMEGALRTMFVTKMKWLGAAVLSVALVGGGGSVGYRSVAVGQEAGSSSTSSTTSEPETVTALRKQAEQLAKQLHELKDREAAVTDQLNKLLVAIEKQKVVPKATSAGKAGMSAGLSTTVLRNQDIEDEIELLKARLQAKEAALTASKSLKDEATRRYTAMTKSRQAARGSISDEEFYAAKLNIERYSFEEVQKKAEVMEAQILLKQAERRLSGGATTISTSIEQRIKQLEERVATLEAALNRGRSTGGMLSVPGTKGR